MISQLIMATYARINLVTTRHDKLTVSFIVFATQDWFRRIPIRWMLTWNFFPTIT
jgi:hypothetical protein